MWSIVAKYSMEVQNVMKEQGYNPMKGFMVPLFQVLLFKSTFYIKLKAILFCQSIYWWIMCWNIWNVF